MATATKGNKAFQEAIKEIRSKGVKIAQNLAHDGCRCGCSGWKTPASWGDRDTLTNYAFSKGTRRDDRFVLFFHHGIGNKDTSVGEIIATTFRKYGFTVNWDGSTARAVEIDSASSE